MKNNNKNANNSANNYANGNTNKEFLHDINETYSAFKAKLKNAQVPIIIRGLNIAEEDKQRLESHIQEMVSKEYLKYIQSNVESPNQTDSDKSQKIKMRTEVSLENLGLPSEIKENLESHIQEMVSKDYLKEARGMSEGEGPCVFTPLYPPGDPQNIAQWRLPPENEWARWTPTFVTTPPWPEDGFWIKWKWSDLPWGQMYLILETGPNVSWAKEIQAWHLRMGRMNSIRVQGASSATPRTILSAASCFAGADTIVFRKPKAFGIWYNMYNLAPAHLFWSLFSQREVIFRWVRD